MGASSTLVVAMIPASKILGLDFDEYKIVELATKIERINCNLLVENKINMPAFGGINFMEFYDNKAVINSLG